MTNPYRLISKTDKYTNPWMNVREDIVVDERTQKEKLFGVVTIHPGSSCLPIDEKGNVYFIQTFRYALGRDSIECVAGANEGTETPEAGAKRELEEELGIFGGEWISLGNVHTLTETIHFQENLFLVRIDTRNMKTIAPEEGHVCVSMSLGEAVEKVMNSEIVHGPSVALVMKANEYLKQHTH